MQMPDLLRGWINQPSSDQIFHHLHGTRVLYSPSTRVAYFLSGDTLCQLIPSHCVSLGWPRHLA